MRDLQLTQLDWIIAWRHLRMGDVLPVWVRWLLVLSVYLIVSGSLVTLYAGWLASLEWSPDEGVPLLERIGSTDLERYTLTFGTGTVVIGVMGLVLGLLASFFNLLPTIITMSVLLGCMALVIVLSLMSGLEGDLRDKILNQKAHIRIARSDGQPFEDYQALAGEIAKGQGIAGVSPYLEGEIMVRSGLNRQAAVLTGIVPHLHAGVSDLPTLVQEGEFGFLEHPEAIPEPDPFAFDEGTPWRLRHLEAERKKNAANVEVHAHDDAWREASERAHAAAVEASARASEAAATAARRSAETEASLRVEHEHDDAPSLGVVGTKAGKLPTHEDDDWDDLPTNGLLRDLLPPPPAPGPRDIEYEPDPLDGWEDPAVELRRLRARGLLPPELQHAAPDASTRSEPPDGHDTPEPAEPEDDEDEPPLDPILIGRELSMELGVRLGAEVQLLTPIGRTTPAGQIPGVLGAQIGGVFYSGMYLYDTKNVYAPLTMVQRFLLTGDRVSGIEVKLTRADAIDAGKAEVERIVGAAGRSDLLVEDWRDLNRNLFSAMFLEKVAMFIALLFVVLVASFGILASNLMSVLEKTKEIAILKAMGMSDGGIARVFIAEGLCVGLLGSFGGIALGLFGCFLLKWVGFSLNENVYYIEKLPVVVNPGEVMLIGIAAMVIVCISSVYPALVASRLRPVDALRQGDT